MRNILAMYKMLKISVLFGSGALLATPALANRINIDEAGAEGTLPIVTVTNDAGSTFLKSATATAVACPNGAVVTECWRIDVIAQGQILVSWGSTYGLELSEPGTGVLSDSFGSAASVPDNSTDTSDISFQLFSDDLSGNLGGRASVCQQQNGCILGVEDGTFQPANQGLTVGDSPNGNTTVNRSFDIFLKSDVGDAPVDTTTVPDPGTLVLFGSGLISILGVARRKSFTLL